MLQWKVLVGSTFLATVVARATVLVILCCHPTISMVTSAAVTQAVLFAAYLYLLHRLLSFAITVVNTSYIIIFGFLALMTTLVVSEMVATVLTVRGEGPHSTAWRGSYSFGVTVLGWVILYIPVCMRTGSHSRQPPASDRAPPAAISTQPCAAEPAPSPGVASDLDACERALSQADAQHEEAAENLEACAARTATDDADARAWHSADVRAAAVAEREAAAQQLGEANASWQLELERRETKLDVRADNLVS